MAKKLKESVSAEESVPAEEVVEKAVAVIPEPDPESESIPEPIRIPSSSGPTFGQRVWRFFSFLLRLLSILLVLGVGLYFGLLLYQRFIVTLRTHGDQIQVLGGVNVQIQQTAAALQDHLSVIETQQADQAQSFIGLDGRLDEIETEIEARTQSLAALEKMQATLQAEQEETSAEFERQLDLLKSMELLSRARLFMYQSNFGLAKQDVQAAYDLLLTVRPDAPESLADDLDAVILRLSLTLTNLPDFPVAAADDLDIAWQILLGGLPPAQTVVNETPAAGVTITPTPTFIFTPTPTTTIVPTAIP